MAEVKLSYRVDNRNITIKAKRNGDGLWRCRITERGKPLARVVLTVDPLTTFERMLEGALLTEEQSSWAA